MSKRELKKHLSQLDQQEMIDQFLELYDKFPNVKTYYDFIFNPKEEKLLGEARQKILYEYFPVRGKRPKQRRSTAQKFIKHFKSLGMDASALTELMLFNLQTAMKFSNRREIRPAFSTSMLKSYRELIDYANVQGVTSIFESEIKAIASEAKRQNWENYEAFQLLAVDI